MMTFQLDSFDRFSPLQALRVLYGAMTLAALVLGGSSLHAQNPQNPGTELADRIEQRLNEVGPDRSSRDSERPRGTQQEQAYNKLKEAVTRAGAQNPGDAEAVKKDIRSAIDRLKNEYRRQQAVVQYVERLANQLQERLLRLADRPVEDAEWRIENESTGSSAQEKAKEEAKKAAAEAGAAHPNDPEAAIEKALEGLEKSYRDKRDGATADWVKGLLASLKRQEYILYEAPSRAAASTAARLVLTGTVVAGQTATASVVDGSGATLSGVVVEVNGQQHVSDERGRVVFPVAAGLATLVASLPGHSGSTVHVPVVEPRVTGLTAPPSLSEAPPFVSTGQSFPIEGAGFSGEASGNTVRLGPHQLDVLAASPVELVVAAPIDVELGEQPLTVSTGAGSSDQRKVDLVALRLESEDTMLSSGQKGEAFIVVEGSGRPVTLEITNLDPETIALNGGDAIEVRTSGGKANRAKIRYRALSPGSFQVTAVIVDGNRR